MDVILADGDIYIVEGRRVYENELFANLRTFCDNKRREFEKYKNGMLEKLKALREKEEKEGEESMKLQKQQSRDDDER